MIIALHADSLLPAGTILEPPSRFEVGRPASNVLTEDPRQRAVWQSLFTVVAGVSDRIGAGGVEAALDAGVYALPEFRAHVEARLLAAGADSPAVYWQQGSAERYRWRIDFGAPTTLRPASTPQDALVPLMGYRRQDRSASTSHAGDMAAPMGGWATITVDLAAALGATGAFLAAPGLSAAADLRIGLGATSDASDAVYYAAEVEPVTWIPYAPGTAYRYAQLAVCDPRREDWPRPGIGMWWHGSGWDTRGDDAENYRVGGPQRAWEPTATVASGRRSGIAFISEVAPRERISVAFFAGASARERLRDLALAAGRAGLLWICTDPEREPSRSTALVRLTAPPSIADRAGAFPRYSVELSCERVDM